MKDKSKKLTVINTDKKIDKTEEKVVSYVAKPSSLNASLVGDYLPMKTWNKVFEFRKDNNGIEYLFGKLPLVLQHGVTMYAEGDVDVPSLAEGLPYDGRTIWFNPETQQIEVIGGTGGGEGGTSNFWELNGIPSWITQAKPTYQYSEIKNTPDLSVYATTSLLNQTLAGYVTNNALINTLLSYPTFTDLRDELKGYVNVDYKQDVVGIKNFINGIQIGELPITKLQDDVIYIDANLVVRGGVTMFYENGELDMPTIVDEIGIAGYDGKKLGLVSFSSSQFSIDANGNVTIKGGSTGLDTEQLYQYLTSNKYATQSWVTSQGYASATTLSALQSKVNDFLEGSDTDTIINKWKELESFLSGLSESDNLSDILATKANQSSLDATNATVATKWTQNDSKISNWDTAFSWGDHSKNDYTTNKYVNDTFVTIGGNTEQTITGAKNFTGGLKVNGSPIIYDATNKYWKLEGDLLVTGGVTMYGVDESDLPSILDSLPIASTTALGIAKYDSNYFSVNSDGLVTLINAPSSGATSGLLGSFLLNVDDSVDTIVDYDRVLYQPAGSSMWTWKNLSEIGSSGGGSVSGDYLPLSGGTLTGNLTLGNSSNTSHIGYYINRSGNTIGLAPDYNCACLRFATSTSNTNFLRLANGALDLSYDGGTNWNNILHSGNISSYNAGSANRINAYQHNSDDKIIISGSRTDNAFPRKLVDNGYGLVVERYDNVSKTNIRNYIATLSDNVASATKLQTARTIWGQSFDGTSDITQGDITVYANSGSTTSLNLFKASNDVGWQLSGRYSSIESGFKIYYYDKSKWNNYLYIGTNGNVGIGYDNPSYKLDVNGTIRFASKTIWGQRFDGTGNVSGDIYLNNSNFIRVADTSGTSRKILTLDDSNNVVLGCHTADASYDTYIDGLNIHIRSGKHNEVIHINSSGKVGIGTTSPAEKLDINGTISSIGLIVDKASDNNSSINLRGTTTDLWQISARYGNDKDSLRMYYYNGSTWAQTLSVTTGGNMTVLGGVTMYSDARKKTILNNVELSLKQIANAPLIEHYYNSDQEKTTHVGSIAQYWYGMNDWFCKEDSEGFLTMEIQNCALASAISIARELERYESKTDKTIRKIKQRIAELEEEVERLKQN